MRGPLGCCCCCFCNMCKDLILEQRVALVVLDPANTSLHLRDLPLACDMDDALLWGPVGG